MTPPTDASAWFEFEDRGFQDPFWKYGGNAARLRVIFPDTPKLKVRNPNGYYCFPTSRGDDDEKQLSPFFLGPCRLYGNTTAKRMENAW